MFFEKGKVQSCGIGNRCFDPHIRNFEKRCYCADKDYMKRGKERRKIMIAIMAILLISMTAGTAFGQEEKGQIVTRLSEAAAEEMYYGVKLSIPYNSTEDHTTNFSVTITDLDHRPIAISGIIHWHNMNVSSTKNDTALNNAWVKNAVISNVIQYLKHMNVSEVNANRSLIENETRTALTGWGEYWGEFNVNIDNISLDNISFLMNDNYRCKWISDAATKIEKKPEEKKTAISKLDELGKMVTILLVGVVIGMVINEWIGNKS